MRTTYKLLIIGRIYNNHLIRFIQNLKNENGSVQIDVFSLYKEKQIPKELVGLISKEYYLYIGKDHRSKIMQKASSLIDIIKLISFFNRISEHYDIINIHYPSYFYTFCYRQLKNISDHIVLTAWGSDVYRCNWTQIQFLKILYRKADYVTAVSSRFRDDLLRIFGVPSESMPILDMASDTIDYIVDNKQVISSDEAKRKLNVSGKYVICCGYNGQRAQQHIAIIKSLSAIKKHLPSNFVLFLPFMYGGDETYKIEVIKIAEDSKFKYRIFESYLDTANMFLLEQATDMLIHVQTTDASSCSIQEFILLEKKIINGEWLKYPQLTSCSIDPYFVTSSIESLPETISDAITANIIIPHETIDYIKSNGWRSWIKKWNQFFISIIN